MNLGSRFCRTCGSKILVRNVCHNCRSNPLTGNNYCYDCGTLTPSGIRCTNCGTNFKTKSQVKVPMFVIALFIILALGAAVIFFLPKADDNNTNKQNKNTASQERNILENNHVSQIKTDSIKVDTLKTVTTSADTISFFSAQEIKSYPKTCAYFKKNNRDSVLFFFNKQTGYLKINGNVVELRRTKKSADLATFVAENYEAKVMIDGLSGTSNEWLAAVSLIIKNIDQKTSVKHKLYSACIEF